MPREGRQHGSVMTYGLLPPDINPKPKSRVLNRRDGPPTAGAYTKVPTNQSKVFYAGARTRANHRSASDAPPVHKEFSSFTGRCSKTMWASCHFRPACKSKDKAKGNHRLKSSAMDSRDKLGFNGVSATRALDHLYEDNWTVESDGDVEYASNDE